MDDVDCIEDFLLGAQVGQVVSKACVGVDRGAWIGPALGCREQPQFPRRVARQVNPRQRRDVLLVTHPTEDHEVLIQERQGLVKPARQPFGHVVIEALVAALAAV